LIPPRGTRALVVRAVARQRVRAGRALDLDLGAVVEYVAPLEAEESGILRAWRAGG